MCQNEDLQRRRALPQAVRSHSLGSWGLQSLARLAYLLLRAGWMPVGMMKEKSFMEFCTGRREGLQQLLQAGRVNVR